MSAAETIEYRLPYAVAPRRYELHLAPDLEAFTFAGEVAIEVEVLETTDRVVLNAVELELTAASLEEGWGDEPRHGVALSVEEDPDNERVTLLAPDAIAPGRYRLHGTFSGTLNDKMHGFYRSTYTDTDGVEQVLAVTQFESADARRCFPCFDEPDRKAAFVVSLDLPPGLSAVSNAPEVASEDLGGGRRRVRFAPTPVMSSYLVAIVVGRLEASAPVVLEGVPVRVVTVAGKSHLHEAAIAASAHALSFYRSYFALPYLGEKLDLVAVPDFAFGAMENVGCVTFREAILLADPANTSRPELERLVEVTEHELAHMWFGDLVTMRWWNGLWLNESFATFMALCCADDFHPEWHTFAGFARGRAVAQGIDALHSTRPVEAPVRTPAEAEAMVDTLTYEKGASVLWMVEAFVGREAFRAGIRHYLEHHEFSNAETTELWEAIGEQTEDLPIHTLMDSWIFQGGVPLVNAACGTDKSGKPIVTLTQEPFTYLDEPPAGAGSAVGSEWLIPLIVRHGDDLAHESRLLLHDTAALGGTAPLLINGGGSGYYRVAYDDELYRALLAELTALSAIERHDLASDTWALCLARRAPLTRFFDLVAHLRDEVDPNVLSVVAGAVSTLDLVADEPGRAALAGFVRRYFAPILARVGVRRRDGEELDDALVRATAIGVLGLVGNDESLVAGARRRVAADLAGTEPLDPDLAVVYLGIFAAHANGPELDALLARLAHPRDPKDESRIRASLANVADPDLARRVRQICLAELRAQDAPYVLAAMLRSRPTARDTHEFVTEHFDELRARVADYGVRRILDGLPGLAVLDDHGGEVDLAGVRSFWQERIVGAHSRHLAQALERLETNVAFARAVRGELGSLAAG